ncbi:hypothetical protein L9F63_011180, partial [Diploptera punctata]
VKSRSAHKLKQIAATSTSDHSWQTCLGFSPTANAPFLTHCVFLRFINPITYIFIAGHDSIIERSGMTKS